jgi:hypothetical protein
MCSTKHWYGNFGSHCMLKTGSSKSVCSVTLVSIIVWFDYTVQCDSNVYLCIHDAFTCFGQLMTIFKRQITTCWGNYYHRNHNTSSSKLSKVLYKDFNQDKMWWVKILIKFLIFEILASTNNKRTNSLEVFCKCYSIRLAGTNFISSCTLSWYKCLLLLQDWGIITVFTESNIGPWLSSICYGNEGVASSVSHIGHYVIRKLVDSVFSLILVFVRWWETQM